MPKKLDTKKVKDLFNKYGYTLPDNFEHINTTTKYKVFDERNNKYTKLSYNQLQYRIKNGLSEYDAFDDYYNIALSEDEPRIKNSIFDIALSDKEPVEKPVERNKSINNIAKELIKKLLLQKDFAYNVKDNKDILYALMYAIKSAGSKINKDIRMTIIDDNNNISYYHGNMNTVNFLYDIINEKDNISDSNTLALDTFKNIKSIRFEFKDLKNGKRVNPGFFPYINTTDIDLTKYGIFNDINNEYINESCLIQSFIASNSFTDNEINMLRSFVNTRTVPLEQLKYIADLLKVHINVRYMANKGFTHRDYGNQYDKTIKLIIIDNHYMLNESINISIDSIKNYSKNKTIEYTDKSISIYYLIDTMKKCNLLKPMDINTYNKLCWSYKTINKPYNSYRLINIPDKKSIPKFVKRMKHGKKLFGYDINSDSKLIFRINQLQNLIYINLSKKLSHRVDVVKYYRYSDLMLKIMYEYGCFDGVYELSGDIANKIRNECIFPKTIWEQVHLTGKYYYIDLNGAYMSSVISIPTGKPDENGNFKGENTKIKQLIEILYNLRMKAKKSGDSKLATTLKFMMNSCWGSSIRKPPNFNKKLKTDVDKYIEEFAPYVIKYDNDNYVYTVKPYREHFIYPQFARSVLNNFNDKMNYIKSIVSKVYYSKVDSLLISEEDYNKLNELGYIGDKLGQFKVEHIFKEIYIKSADNWIGKNIDNEYIYHVNNKYKNICSESKDPIKKLMDL